MGGVEEEEEEVVVVVVVEVVVRVLEWGRCCSCSICSGGHGARGCLVVAVVGL